MYDELIKRLRETSVDFGESDHVSVMMIEAANAIEDLITALKASNEVIAKNKRKHGKWETAYLDHEAFGIRPQVWYCSECQQITSFRTFFCPNCGADMRGDSDV